MRAAIFLLATALLLAAAPAAVAKRTVPQGFFGTTWDGPLVEPGAPLEREARVMVKSGVETVRTAFYWRDAQPFRTFAEVPEDQRARFRDEGGVPTDWSRIDRVVALGAVRGFRLIPNVLGAPSWAARHPGRGNSPPAGTEPYARFFAALVRRYGPRGDFWRERPDVPRRPQREWQVWNEPNQPVFFWSDQPFAKDYVALLRAARKAIKSEDRRAKVILAGLVGRSWQDLERIYKAGGRGLFDIAAIHPFTLRVNNVMTLVRNFRKVLDRRGDRRIPIIAGEIAWPSAKGKVDKTYGYEVSEKEQASKLAQVYPRLIKERRRLKLQSAIWYTWASLDTGRNDPFAYSGLRRLSGDRLVSKPAYSKYRSLARRYEGCAKASTATRCR